MSRRLTLALCVTTLALVTSAAFAQDTAQGVVQAICGDNGALITKVLAVIAGSSLLANVRPLLDKFPLLGAVVHFCALNFPSFVQALSSAGSKSKNAAGLVLVVLAGLALSACSAAQIQATQSNLATVNQSLLQTVQVACAEYNPVAASLATTNDPKVADYLKYGNSVCGAVTGTLPPGAVPPAGPVQIDASTAAWVGAITGAVKALSTAPAAPPPAVVKQ